LNLPRHTSRLAAGIGVAAMTATALVGATAGTASAAPVSGTYSCTVGGIPAGSFTTTVDALLPPTAPAGAAVPAGLLGFTASVKTGPGTNASPAIAATTSGKSSDFSFQFGTTTVSAPIANAARTDNADQSVTFTGKGTNAAFVTPKAGTYDITMPAKFTLEGSNAAGASTVTATCTTTAPVKLSSVALSKQTATITAKAKATKVKIAVANEYSAKGGELATGKVTVKDGKKKLGKGTLKNGKLTLKLKGNKKLTKGKHKLVISYAGDDFTNKAKAKVTVKIK
jgi:hypothetical protein